MQSLGIGWRGLINVYGMGIGWREGGETPRTAFPTVCFQNSFSDSHTSNLVSPKALRALMPSRCFLFIPFFRAKSQKGQTKNRSSEKLHTKDRQTNIIATNFLGEQLEK